MIPIISIIFAFGLPIYFFTNHAKNKHIKRPYIISVASFTSCSTGIIAELLCIKQRLLNHDIGGIEDTIWAVIVVCIFMLITTVILNLMVLGLAYEHN